MAQPWGTGTDRGPIPNPSDYALARVWGAPPELPESQHRGACLTLLRWGTSPDPRALTTGEPRLTPGPRPHRHPGAPRTP